MSVERSQEHSANITETQMRYKGTGLLWAMSNPGKESNRSLVLDIGCAGDTKLQNRCEQEKYAEYHKI